MAIAPCDIHGLRYRGKAVHIYGALAVGDLATRRHLRVCPDCGGGIVEYLQSISRPPNEVQMYEPLEPNACSVCDRVVTPLDPQAYITMYMPGDDRLDFWFRFHLACAAEYSPFSLIDQEPLRGADIAA